MDQATHNKIVSFIRGIADDLLRDLFKRGLKTKTSASLSGVKRTGLLWLQGATQSVCKPLLDRLHYS
jgi:hypothetical protein